jgi:hypothetical protein
MILTEQEAKTKLCPFMSCRNSQSKGADGDGVVFCQASDCMAWRWGDNSGPEDLAWRQDKPLPKGFCGA